MTDGTERRQGTELRNLYRGALFVTAGALALAWQGILPAPQQDPARAEYSGMLPLLYAAYFGPGLAMLAAAIAFPARRGPGGFRIVLAMTAAAWSVLVAWLLLSFRAMGLPT
jgi:hypothetical protein